MNVLIIDSSAAYNRLFEGMGFKLTSVLAEANLVVFTGGADVTPSLYGDKAHYTTGNSPFRDAQEKQFFKRALQADIPMVGICRGAQFLNVMSGGRMYQDVTEHCGDHEITDLVTGEIVLVSSTHHQMMMPPRDALIVATSSLAGKREWFDGEIAKKDISSEDIEVVYYRHTNSLCFQPHPEFVSVRYEPMKEYFGKCMERFLNIELVAA